MINQSTAIVITGGLLDTYSAKTAHGLIRGTERFNILAFIDEKFAGKDAGEILDGKNRKLPIYANIKDYLLQGEKPKYCIVGVATKGGFLPPQLQNILKEALINGINIVNGLHHYVSDIDELASIAIHNQLEIIDVRKPKKFQDLHFWNGSISEVKSKKIAVLGTDCALGKRTTTRFLVEEMRLKNKTAEMIYTGQTGWMQGAKFGFIFDSTLNDFISGEMEHAIVSCYQELKPDYIFIEGQSSLRNPSGPAGSEWIISAEAKWVILQHSPIRKQYKDLEFYHALIPSLADEISLIQHYGGKVIGITLNTAKMDKSEALLYAENTENELNIPVVLPVEQGVSRLVDHILKLD